MTGPERGPDPVPANLALAMARLFEAELDFRDSAGPWLAGELPAPMLQLKELMDRLTVVRERAADVYAAGREQYWLIKAQYERDAAA